MKNQIFVSLTVLMVLAISCQEQQTQDEEPKDNGIGLKFCAIDDGTVPLARYTDILGYDTAKHVFMLSQAAWTRMNDRILPTNPNPQPGFNLALNNLIIYGLRYIPGYISMSYNDIITYRMVAPNLVYVGLGYPPDITNYKGTDYRNDTRIITQLINDNKLIQIGD